jgi:hypothetical protein
MMTERRSNRIENVGYREGMKGGNRKDSSRHVVKMIEPEKETGHVGACSQLQLSYLPLGPS